jgi:hypothetical protein
MMALPDSRVVVGLGPCLSVSRRHSAQLAALGCVSPSIISVFPVRASMAAKWTDMVDFPTPPLVFTTA